MPGEVGFVGRGKNGAGAELGRQDQDSGADYRRFATVLDADYDHDDALVDDFVTDECGVVFSEFCPDRDAVLGGAKMRIVAAVRADLVHLVSGQFDQRLQEGLRFGARAHGRGGEGEIMAEWFLDQVPEGREERSPTLLPPGRKGPILFRRGDRLWRCPPPEVAGGKKRTWGVVSCYSTLLPLRRRVFSRLRPPQLEAFLRDTEDPVLRRRQQLP